ncbi:MAG: signal peptide peptidase SppA [Flavobacteriales bacterium]|nr:signal peptide peptidase SppA [Flavobacteriales bacterium]
MRQFFKFMFASMLGFILGSVAIGIIFMVMIIGAVASLGSAFSMESKPTTVKDNSVLLMTLDRPIVDRGREEGMLLDFGPFRGMGELGLNDILDNLEKAKRDEHIKGIFLDLGMVNARMATMKEIRDKILEFKAESGKPVIAYGDVFTQGTYYLASAADEVYLVPEGDLDFRGLQTEMMFYKGLFDKLDIEVQFIRGTDNKYKSYGEAFTNTEMSPANEEQMSVLVHGLWDHYLGTIAETRKIDKARLNTIADSLLIRHAPDAVTYGLVDGVKYRDEVLTLLKQKMGLDSDKEIQFAGLGKYTRTVVPEAKGEGKHTSSFKRPKLAVVYAEGSIMDGESSDGTIGGTTLSAAIREAREDTTVKAIVLRVNSPGGSGLASDVIWREVKLATAVKPVVVSMGDVAASGGYYISCAANKIYADPTTITGSIGVFGMIPNMQGFFNDKLGITFDGVKTNTYAGMMTTSRALTADEKRIIQQFIDRFYDTFTSRVAEGRHMTQAQVDSIAQGRVWTGVDAKRLGLVDELGGLEAAITDASKLAGLTEGDFRIVGYPEQEDVFKELLKELNGEAKSWVATQVFGTDAELFHQFEKVRQVKQMSGIQARMPFDLEVH